MNDIDLEALKRVDEVSSLIKKLVNNPVDNESTIKDIDTFLSSSKKENDVFNKTVINKQNNHQNIQDNNNETFMKELERDAEERSLRKAKSKAKAEIIKCKANDYFRANDFETAIKYYSQAITECKDFDILYTNRAQAYLKINQPQEALDDCEMALRICPRNHKAILHQGRALVRLNRFDEAMDSYKAVLEIAPNLKSYLEEFFDECTKLKQHLALKQTSALEFDTKGFSSRTDDSLNEILDKLQSTNEGSMEYFVGGLELVVQLLSKDDHCTKLEPLKQDLLSCRGLYDDCSNIVIKVRNVLQKDNRDVAEIEWTLLSLWIHLLKILTKGDDTCTTSLFNNRDFVGFIDFCGRSTNSIPFSLLCHTLFLLFRMSNLELGVINIFDKFTLNAVLSITLASLNLDQSKQFTTVGLALLRNLVQSQRFKIAMSKDDILTINTIDCIYLTFIASANRNSEDDLTTVIDIVELMSDNGVFRSRLIKHNKFLEDCMKTIECRLAVHDDDKHFKILLKLFTLIHNLMVRSKNCPIGDRVKSLCERIVTSASHLLCHKPEAEMRSVLIQVLSQMVVVLPDPKLKLWCEFHPSSSNADRDDVSMCRSLSRRQSSLTDMDYLDKVCKPLQICVTILDAHDHPLLPYAIKILTLASRVNQAVRFLCCDVRERVLKLQTLLYKDKQKLDEVLSGNICLLFINCVNETPLAEHLSDTDIIKDLLRICADANKNDCRRNAAIFAGNLAQSNHLHRNELSKLNGFNIISKFSNWSK